MRTQNPSRPDLSNLSDNMRSLLDLLEITWNEADEDGTPELAWVGLIKRQTVKALRRRGVVILARQTYYGPEYRLADPHPSGLGF